MLRESAPVSFGTRLGLAASAAVMFWSSEAGAIDRVVAERVAREVAEYARSKGVTAEDLAQRLGSSLWHIESFVYGYESNGGTAVEALNRLERFSEALRDPDRREYLRCLGIPMPQDTNPAPSPLICAALRRKLNAP